MKRQMNGHNVNEAMHNEGKAAKRANKMAFFTMVESEPIGDKEEARLLALGRDKTWCSNCEGAGQLGIETFIAGPFTNAQDKKHVTYYEGTYYVHELALFYCPDCSGSGLFSRQAPRPAKVQL